MLCIFCCSTQRNIVYYLLIFCIPIRSPSIQYTSHFYLLWKVGIWAIENLNFKNHSLVIRNRIHHISQENSFPSLSMIRVCSQFIIFGVFFFSLSYIFFFLVILFFLFLKILLENSYFTLLCQFLPYIKMN